MDPGPSAQKFMFRVFPSPLCDSDGVKIQFHWRVQNPTKRFVCVNLCVNEISYVYSSVYTRAPCLDDNPVRYLDISAFATLSQQWSSWYKNTFSQFWYKDGTCWYKTWETMVKIIVKINSWEDTFSVIGRKTLWVCFHFFSELHSPTEDLKNGWTKWSLLVLGGGQTLSLWYI